MMGRSLSRPSMTAEGRATSAAAASASAAAAPATQSRRRRPRHRRRPHPPATSRGLDPPAGVVRQGPEARTPDAR
jgi:hypothetical protein